MATIDNVLPVKTNLDLHRAFWNAFTARMVATSVNAKNIPVHGLTMCWYCRKDFMAPPFTVYCSPKCQDGGEDLEDNWRQE